MACAVAAADALGSCVRPSAVSPAWRSRWPLPPARVTGWRSGTAGVFGHLILLDRIARNVQRSYSPSCARYRTPDTAKPSSRRPSAGSQTAFARPSQNAPSMASPLRPLRAEKCNLCLRNVLLPMSRNGQSTTSKIAWNARTSKRTYIRVAGTGCAKNSRHTVAAAMLTASTLSSHHVRL